MPPSAVRALSIHADYRCRHSGQCCSTDWDVPMALPVYRSLADAVAAGRLRAAPGAEALEPFVVDPDLPDEDAAVFGRTEAGGCVFFDRGSHLCVVHRDLGARLLPVTCRVFPRVAVDDGRGTSVALSHFCPTAAAMLFRTDVPVAIVAGPEAFPPDDYDGLTVGADDLPPLLRPDMLMDLEGYAAWEAHMVARCAALTRAPESVLATLWRDAMLLRTWRPGAQSLADAVARLPHEYIDGAAHVTLRASLALHQGVLAAVPPEYLPPPDEEGLDEAYQVFVRPQWGVVHAPVNRYLAAKAFASWTAYQGRGVLTIVRGLEAAVALVRVEASRQCRDAGRPLDEALLLEAFRSADFLLNHLAVGEDLAEGWAACEDA